MLTVIPFSGFYYSMHDEELDRELKNTFTDYATGLEINQGLLDRAFRAVDWDYVHRKYAGVYAENFAQEFNLKTLRYESMRSPREYNFSTDRIFCEIDAEEVRTLFAELDKETLSEVCREMFTSRSGFMSFYSPDWEDWGDLDKWDHNQVFTLITAMVRQVKGEDWGGYEEFALMGDCFCNGYSTEWLFGSNPEELKRLDRIHDYLQKRAAR